VASGIVELCAVKSSKPLKAIAMNSPTIVHARPPDIRDAARSRRGDDDDRGEEALPLGIVWRRPRRRPALLLGVHWLIEPQQTTGSRSLAEIDDVDDRG
jgi:hypothetical protein